MSHHHASGDPMQFTSEFWDARYRSAGQIWSGNPNRRLVEHVADLPPATALDVGSGEGADSIWLASQGWQVTAIDVSTVALDRAAARAAELGPTVANRITWQQTDLLSWDPDDLSFDLVSAQFMHLPGAAQELLHTQLAAAVRPGGRLLIVAHHPSDLHTSMARPGSEAMFLTAEQVADRLDPADWQILVAGAPERQAVDPEGREITVRDAVLYALRRP